MLNLKTYTAPSMPTALMMVKKDLGNNAVILHTRTYRRGGILGIGARTVIEITAADGAQMGRANRTKAEILRAQALEQVKAKSSQGDSNRGKTPANTADRQRRNVTESRNESREEKRTPAEQPLAGDLIRRTYAAAKHELNQAQAREQATATIAVPVAQTKPVVRNPVQQQAAPSVTTAPLPQANQLSDEMRMVKQMVSQMMRQQQRFAGKTSSAAHGAPDLLFDEYLKLLSQEVAEELADEVVQEVRDALLPEENTQPETIRQAIFTALSKLIPTDAGAGMIEPTTDGRPRTIALIGPTGVGKTTTIAKLAATFKLKQKKKVGLVTLDTYRIAAVDQLRTYANILNVELHVALTPEELKDALTRCASCDVVLIDTAGRSQRDDPKLEQLSNFIEAANPHEVHLVLSSTSTQAVLLQTVERFSKVRADMIIFTKLDEAVSFGVVLNVMRQVRKKLSYVTTGQEVPHQIEPGKPGRIADLLLGGRV